MRKREGGGRERETDKTDEEISREKERSSKKEKE